MSCPNDDAAVNGGASGVRAGMTLRHPVARKANPPKSKYLGNTSPLEGKHHIAGNETRTAHGRNRAYPWRARNCKHVKRKRKNPRAD